MSDKNTLRLEKSILSNAVFAVHVLFLFLLLFETKLSIPPFLQSLGRAHPLLLHLPIGLLFFLALLPLLKKELSLTNYISIRSFLLHLCAITAACTALMGFFLSQEEGYNSDLMVWHKWTGIGVSFLTYALLLLHENLPKLKKLFHIGLYTNIALLLAAGHFGGSITHGADYVLAPLQSKETPAIQKSTPIYIALIQPILEAKCYSCHNEGKAKGDLIMTSLASLQKGGKHGAIWIAGNTDSSHLLQRLHLPLEDELHMPPEGKEQLSTQEVEFLHQWVLDGANTEKTFEQYSEGDTLLYVAQQLLAIKKANLKEISYDFEAANEAIIADLNTPFCAVLPVAQGSAALNAVIFVRNAYKESYLTDLLNVKEQLVALNLANLPIKDEDLQTIGQFENLEQLILNNTDITGATLLELKTCKKLKQIAFSSTAIQEEHLQKLEDFAALEKIFIWNTALSEAALERLKEQNIIVENGYTPDSKEELQLSPPLLKNKSTFIAKGEKIRLENKFPGVHIRYTTDGSEPDSLSPIFQEALAIENLTALKAQTFRENWLPSKVARFQLFPEGIAPDTIQLLNPADVQYQGNGAFTLMDKEKANPNVFRNNRWLGFRDVPFKVLVDFEGNTPEISKVLISFCENNSSQIMLPKQVEVWGSNDKKNLQQLVTTLPDRAKDYGNNRIFPITLELPPAKYRYYQIIATQLPRLPKWHYGYTSKNRSWVFVDEVFFY